MAGVSPASVTKASKGCLKESLVGNCIDMDHPDAVAYIEKHTKVKTSPKVKGIDPFYEEAIKFCQENNRYSKKGLQVKFGIGWGRAKAILETMEANNISKESTKKAQKQEKSKKKPHVRGPAAAKKNKERNSLVALTNQVIKGENAEENSESNPFHNVPIPENIEPFVDMTLRELIKKFGTVFAFNEWLSAVKRIEDINEKRLKNANTEGDLVSRKLVERGIIDPIEAMHRKLLTDGAKTIAQRSKTLFEAGSELLEIEEFTRKHISTFIKTVKGKVRKSIKNV